MFNRKFRSSNTERARRGLAPLGLVVATVVPAASLVYWNQAGWRVERTDEKMVCGVERDLMRLTGERLEPATGPKPELKTETQACAALIATTMQECPLIASSSIEACKSVPGAESLKNRVLVTPVPLTPLVRDTGVWDFAVTRATGAGFAMLASLSPDLASRVGAWGTSAPPDAWFAGFRAKVGGISTKSIDGKPCPSPNYSEDTYLVNSHLTSCLGVAIGSNAFVTAAHCLPPAPKGQAELSNVVVKWNDEEDACIATCKFADPKVNWVECDKDKSPLPSGDCVKDVAVCRLKSTPHCAGIPPKASGQPVWDREVGLKKLPTELYVTSRSNACVKLDKTLPIQNGWPPDNGTINVIETVTLGEKPEGGTCKDPINPVSILEGDSGGAVFDRSGPTGRQLIGIVIRESSKVDGCTILPLLPLYLYRDLAPKP